MYISLNLEKMHFIATGDYAHLAAHALVNYPIHAYTIFPVDHRKSFDILTDMELRLLLLTSTGEDSADGKYSHQVLVDKCMAAALKVPPCCTPMYELDGRAEVIEAQENQDNPVIPQKPAISLTKAPKRTPSSEKVERPKGGTTAKVWEIADQVLGDETKPNLKELRAKIIEACTEAGINQATAGVQYSKWKNFKNFV